MGFVLVSDTRIIWEEEGERIIVEPYGRDCIRFRSSPSPDVEMNDWTLLPPNEAAASVETMKDGVLMRNGAISCAISSNGMAGYYDAGGHPLLEEEWSDRKANLPPIRRAREYKYIRGGDHFSAEIYFKADPEEHFYGMGQHADDCLDIKGCVLELAQKNTQTAIPFLLSSKGYGFVWNNPAIGRAELVNNHTMWRAEATKNVDYLIFAGDTPAKVNRIFLRLYGMPASMPPYITGYWQSKLRYETQEELLRKVREHVVVRKLPMDVVVIDFYHWTQHGEWKFDPACWPEPEKMINELEDMGVKAAVSIWPTVDQRSENYAYMKEHNLLIRTDRNAQTVKFSNGALIYYDATREEAREFVWEKVKKNYYEKGIHLFWLDESEPGMLPYDYDNVRYSAGTALAVSNYYPYAYARGFYEGQKKEGLKEPANLIRSAWLGSQRYGVILWSGDIPSTFDSLRRQIKVGLSVALCGIPWWTMDIGGFFGGNGNSEEFVELLIRWFQFGVFCPVLRMHGNRYPYSSRPHGMTEYTPTSGENQVWSYGEKAYGIFCRYLKMREELKPYLTAMGKKASQDGTPIMRPLFYEFPHDAVCWKIEDEYLFGDSILVAPIYEYRARTRNVYLPEGSVWYSQREDKTYDGGQYIEAGAPLEEIPVFFRGDFKGKGVWPLV